MITRQEAIENLKEGVHYKLVTPQEAKDYVEANEWSDDILAVNRDGYNQLALILTDLDLSLLDDKIGGDWIYMTYYDEYERYVLGLPS